MSLNLVDDVFPPLSLCMLTGHIKVLHMRISGIGYDRKNQTTNEEELTECVKDQQNLLCNLINEVIELPMLVQFTVTAINVALGLVAMLFVAKDIFSILYYVFYLFGILMQTFPTCYFGSNFEFMFDELLQAIYSSNWLMQSPKYKKHMILFMQRALKKRPAYAGGILRIHLDTFFSTCKAAYSVFAMVWQLKN
ncbi:odorant receptor 59a-like [Teleopsis dalmanni]|uniref:odorant receptor 59a-like n=1 Tax=Teleopsis dalmanni TaxID=139649 RepID=UPI0018CED3FE|nr:odorant receptor 59a-like [Teleopsis dalmanni]XP_037941074.1 odorant receptor 59a-like [Teleopsis dalmanni]